FTTARWETPPWCCSGPASRGCITAAGSTATPTTCWDASTERAATPDASAPPSAPRDDDRRFGPGPLLVAVAKRCHQARQHQGGRPVSLDRVDGVKHRIVPSGRQLGRLRRPGHLAASLAGEDARHGAQVVGERSAIRIDRLAPGDGAGE